VDLYADFLSHDTENIDKLAFSLQNPGQERINDAPNISFDPAESPLPNKPEDSLPTNTKAIQKSTGSSTTRGNNPVASSSKPFESENERARYLALCVNTGAIYKILAEIETSSLNSDANAFSKLKDAYLKARGLRSRLGFLIKPRTIEFVQVSHSILFGMCHCQLFIDP
jgi:hypothetical protein